MKRTILYLLLINVLLATGCKKDDNVIDNNNNPLTTDPGVFTASVNNAEWKPITYVATYYPKWGQVYINASDGYKTFHAGIILNMSSPLRSYPIRSHGENVADYYTGLDWFHTDFDVADIGGSFTLTKFDTIQKKVSGKFDFVAYSLNNNPGLTFNNNIITDINLNFDTLSYDGSFASCSISGANNTTWITKDFYKRVTCILPNGSGKRLGIQMNSILGGSPSYRYLDFRIPLDLPPGTYPIYPHYSYNDCSRPANQVSCMYYMNSPFPQDAYFPTSGTLNIVSIDTVLKKMAVTFNMTLKDSSSNQSIQVSNGQLNINGWKEYGQ